MAKRKKNVIGDIEFKTQGEAISYTREFLLACESKGEIICGDDEWDFLCDLIKGHHEWSVKKGVGVKKFLIGRSAMGGHIELNLVRKDDSFVDISWRKSVTGTVTSPLKNLNSAMREAIEYQIEDFRNTVFSPGSVCYLCEKEIESSSDLHIDHSSPTFLELFELFIEGKVLPTEFEDCLDTNRAIFKEVDLDFKEEWVNYHENNAVLKCAHNLCNLKRKKK
ncbi:DUF3223 domain-containing protein [Halobacteriovorax sp. YZS-1-1]|uniref:DUF3223 domain-containing protein n=1 Tax=unclassified Halobacteriovorax TaxID=2639665 RepID=UPI00399C1581